MAFEAELIARRRGLATVVRLHAGTPDENVSVLLESLAEQELVVPSLVPAEEHAGAIVALDQYARSFEPTREARRVFERRRQMREPDARQLGGGVPSFGGGQRGVSHGGLRG